MSRLDDFVTAIEAQVDDSTVSFEAGALARGEHGQTRRVIFQRGSGRLSFSSDAGRASLTDAFGLVPERRLTRAERITVTVRAEDEDALDTLFDAVANAIFDVAGVNAFEEETEYEWVEGDSTAGGSWAARQPAIRFELTVRLQSTVVAGSPVTLTDADATVSEGDEDVTVDLP